MFVGSTKALLYSVRDHILILAPREHVAAVVVAIVMRAALGHVLLAKSMWALLVPPGLLERVLLSW